MKQKRFLSLLFIPLMALTACGGQQPQTFKTEETVVMPGNINTEKEYTYKFTYDDAFFLRDAKQYDKELAMLSFGSAIASGTKEEGKVFFDTAEFIDYQPIGYDSKPTKDSVGYMLAHKQINNSELIALFVRGLYYEAEWNNNLLVGKSGPHEGFALRANEIYQKLQQYVEDYNSDRTIKLWITGYSRGGGISNLLSDIILQDDKIHVTQDNMFVYTFEAPNCLPIEDCNAYANVHNIINQNDMIPSIPPSIVGMGRCGVDYNIYDENLSSLCKEFDEGMDVPEFVPITNSGYDIKNDADFLNYIIDCGFNHPDPDESLAPYTCNNRTEYVERYQTGLSNLIGYMFSMKYETMGQMFTDLMDMGFMALTVIGDGESLAAFIKPYLDQDQVDYDEATLADDCQALVYAIGYLFISVVFMAISEDYGSNFSRLLDMHFLDTVYVLLVHAHEKN